MAAQGASLQNYNNELVKCIEDLREKREEINRQILKEEEEKAKIQKDLSILTARLQKLNESLTRKQQARNEYDRSIQVRASRRRRRAAAARAWRRSPRAPCRGTAGDGGGVHEDFGELADPAPRPQARGGHALQDAPGLVVRPAPSGAASAARGPLWPPWMELSGRSVRRHGRAGVRLRSVRDRRCMLGRWSVG